MGESRESFASLPSHQHPLDFKVEGARRALRLILVHFLFQFCKIITLFVAARQGRRAFQYADALLDWCEETVEITGKAFSNHLIGS